MPGIRGLATVLFALALPAAAVGQVRRGAEEPPDVYALAPPDDGKPVYERKDPANPKTITNADFFCTECATTKEKRIPFATREQMKEILETTKIFPADVNGSRELRCGAYRLLEHDADDILKPLFTEMKEVKPVFIEDRFFRLFADFGGFHTKKPIYPRREEELRRLADVFPNVSEKTVELDSHQRAHLYLIRAHRVRRDFETIVKHDPKAPYMDFLGPYDGVKQKHEIYVFAKQKQAGAFMKKYLGHSDKLDGECWHTLKDDSMAAIMHCENISDVWLNNTFTHRVASNFLEGFRGYFYDLPPWLVIGFGHLMERRERTDYNTFFFGEGKRPTDTWGNNKWKPAIRKLVAQDKVRPFAELVAVPHVNDLTAEEHGVVWSLVSFLMQQDVEKFGKFIHVLKEKKEGESTYNVQVRAFQTVYGITTAQFAEDWKAWVLKTYPAL